MELKLLSHENTTGEELSKTLKSKRYSDFKIIVAYSRNSGINRIYNELANFADSGGKTSIIAGIDQRNTSYQALVNLKTFAKDNLYIHHDNNFDITFHPKVYLFGNKEIEKVIIGSSNFTAGGLFLNYEANIDVTLDNSLDSKNFKKQLNDYWEGLLRDENTKKCGLSFLDKLLEGGFLADERKQKPFKEIIAKISYDMPFKSKKRVKRLPIVKKTTEIQLPVLKESFAMTLSGFDVSSKSQDPVILIPLAALKTVPVFWNFPMLYTNSGAGYPQLYATANIHIDGKKLSDQHIRIYYYDRKKEFRLQCEAIKRNGNPGDIILIHKDSQKLLEFEIELLRKNSSKYNAIKPTLDKKVSNQKSFTFF
ncbi:MAG: phospholipase D family protein [Bacteroidetes bacterium]|nr:phospholipase D family protein [Bacteroidota bacterium]